MDALVAVLPKATPEGAHECARVLLSDLATLPGAARHSLRSGWVNYGSSHVPPLSRLSTSPDLRMVLRAIVDSEPFWAIGSDLLPAYRLPNDRAELRRAVQEGDS
jgi:hypothetical protein